jgi:hypothetical protein
VLQRARHDAGPSVFTGSSIVAAPSEPLKLLVAGKADTALRPIRFAALQALSSSGLAAKAAERRSGDMRGLRILGACLVAVFATSAIAAATASAAAPELGQCLIKGTVGGAGYSDSKCNKAVGTAAKYEWIPGFVAGKNHFTSTGTTATLKTSGGKTVTCTKETSTGIFIMSGPLADNKHEETQVLFKGCKSSGFTCTTSGKATGELETNVLIGEVNFENVAKTKTDLKLEPGPGSEGFFIKFSCLGLKVEVIGNNPAKPGCKPKLETCVGGTEHGILVPVKPNVMAEKEVLKYKENAETGAQIPSTWQGPPHETYLESDFEELGFERAGQTITSTVKDDFLEEREGKKFYQKYELNTKV